jgi:hypothetical protein
MEEFEVTCINKPDRMSSHEHITHIGNSMGKWRMRREEVINRIEAKKERFYTIDRLTGKKMYIGVVAAVGRLPYLKTHADGKWNDNLLAQTECNGSCNLVS